MRVLVAIVGTSLVVLPVPAAKAADLTVPVNDPDRIVLDAYSDSHCPLVCGECSNIPRCPNPPCPEPIPCCDTWAAIVSNQRNRVVLPDFTYLGGDVGVTSDAVMSPDFQTKFYSIWSQVPGAKGFAMGNHEADPGWAPGGDFYWVDPQNKYAPANWMEPLFGCDSTTAIQNCRRWYSVYLGEPPRVALLVTSSNSDSDFDDETYGWCKVPFDSLNTQGSAQRRWLNAQIDSLPPSVDVVFVAGHRTFYGVENFWARPNIYRSYAYNGQAPAETLRTGAVSFLRDVESIYSRQPNVKRVFMINGDQHCFAETVPIRHNVRDDAHGVVYLTVGIGGGCINRATPFPQLNAVPPHTLVAAFDDHWGSTRFEIARDRVEFTVFEAYTDSVLYSHAWSLGGAAVSAPIVAGRTGEALRVWPNPARDHAQIAFVPHVDQGEDIREISIYDVRGDRVRTLNSGSFEEGELRRTWDLRDGLGRPVANGTYFVRVKSDRRTAGAKVVVARP
ncbi:MAG: FlgD immunoglobulin-like domain containing protein [bacterium]